uniref:hypothetical protein n=2 Tax=Wolbachia TaxID=953 RepID=UPI000AE9D01F|nr:hypothetical protein [Wolbachia endosymbiont of Nomada panzeri]
MKQNMHNNFECDLYIQLSSKCTSSLSSRCKLFLSSQCVTLGSSSQLYERCNVTRCCIINDVIPVRDTGIQFLLYSYLVYLFKIKFSGSQCQSTGMTPFLAEIILKSQCSYSCGSSFVVQFHQKCCIACLFAIKFSGSQCLGTGMTLVVMLTLLQHGTFVQLCVMHWNDIIS